MRQVMGRTTYSAIEEQEAEVMASLVHEWAERALRASSRRSAGERDVVLCRFEAVLDGSVRGGHG